MGFTPFQSIITFLGLIIDDHGKYIQKLSDGILSGAKLKVEDNFKVNMILQQVKVGKSVRPLFRVILTGKFIVAIIVMIQGQRSILSSSKGKYDFYQTKQGRSVIPFFV